MSPGPDSGASVVRKLGLVERYLFFRFRNICGSCPLSSVGSVSLRGVHGPGKFGWLTRLVVSRELLQLGSVGKRGAERNGWHDHEEATPRGRTGPSDLGGGNFRRAGQFGRFRHRRNLECDRLAGNYPARRSGVFRPGRRDHAPEFQLG